MDERVAALAERQHGVFGRGQAVALGVTPSAVQHRLRTGRWELVRPGLYRLPGSPRTWEQRLMAVTLAAGPGAVASHCSSAALLGLAGFRRTGRFDVTIPRSRRSRHSDATVHRT
ncbi:MAG: type IV toxin-antitoxin system AbiEi family antitoxin domain-containing protein, partial [Acidimicrobiales bacterium]